MTNVKHNKSSKSNNTNNTNIESKTRFSSTKKIRPNIDHNEIITIISNTTGGLVYTNGTGSVKFNIPNYGHEHYMTHFELQELRNRQKGMIDNILFIIDNEELIDMWGLRQKYENIIMPHEVDDFFELNPTEMAAKLSKMNNHCQETLHILAYNRFKEGKLDSTAKQNIFTKLRKIDLFKSYEE